MFWVRLGVHFWVSFGEQKLIHLDTILELPGASFCSGARNRPKWFPGSLLGPVSALGPEIIERNDTGYACKGVDGGVTVGLEPPLLLLDPPPSERRWRHDR